MFKLLTMTLLFVVISGQSGLSQSSSLDSYKLCGLHQKARQLAKLIISDPEQKRIKLVCNSLLAKVAEEKAKEMASLKRVSHVGRSYANRRLLKAGYPLSEIYPRLFENNVEAIAGGIKNPEEMWQEFKDSDAHRTHLLAEHEFYQLQDKIGVGFYSDSKTPHVEYWVVYIAHQNGDEEYIGKIAKSKD